MTIQSVRVVSATPGPSIDSAADPSLVEHRREWPRPEGETVVALTYIETDGYTEIVLALSTISAYLKQQFADLRVVLIPIHATSHEPEQSPEGYARRVAESGADVIGVSCLSPDWFALDPYLRALKQRLPERPVALGGYQAILSPEESMAHPAVDFLCIADGERPMADLLRRLRGELDGPVRGMWERLADGGILKGEAELTEDLSEMPFPDYSIFHEAGALKGHGMGAGERFALPVMTGRGCPYRCTYCCNTPLLEQWKGKGKYLRKYDAEALVEEFKRLRERYNVEYFEFWDELFLFNVRFAMEFLELYKREIGLPFSINSRVEKMDEAFCKLAAEAGCDLIWFGIESGSERYRNDRLNRNMSNEQVLTAAENCRKFGIRRLTFNIVGAPFESRDDMLATLELNRKIEPEFFFFFTYLPLRGTSLFKLAEENGLLPESWASDFQEGARTGEYRSNLLPHEGAATPEEFQAICERMKQFQSETETARHFGAQLAPSGAVAGRGRELLPSLAFPLNLFAELQVLEEGGADYLHFGLFEHPDDPIADAQQASTRLILERLPEMPAAILEVGIGLGTTYRTLRALGHSVVGITPDAAQIEVARVRLGGDADLRCTRFEALEAPAEGFSMILFQESAQYIDPLALFNRAFELLAPGGTLLIVDEVALRRTAVGEEELHLADDLVAQAERAGFALEERLDLGERAAPTIDYLLDGIARHRSALIEALPIEEGQVEGLVAALERHRERYADGRFGYQLLRLRRANAPRWRVVEPTVEDEGAIHRLFEACFGHPMDEALWAWKYGEGRGRSMVARRDGEIVAHYGGMGRAIVNGGRDELAVQVGDVMVAPGDRGALTRKGPFLRAAATFLERNIGYGRRYNIGFGFPNARAMRVAEHQRLYAEVGSVAEVHWPALRSRASLKVTVRPLLDDRAGREAVEALWSRMREALGGGLIGVRDWARIRYRYFDHPHHDYRCFVVRRRFGGAPLGVVVLRMEGEWCWLTDVIGGLDELALLIHQARRLAATLGAARLKAWISEPHAERFVACHGERVELDVRIPCCAWTEGPSPEAHRDRWWLMAGDTDFL